MKFTKLSFLLCGVCLLFGCVTTEGTLYVDKRSIVLEEPEGKTPAETFTLVVQDSRQNVDVRALRVPILSLPGQHDSVSPALEKDKIHATFSQVFEDRFKSAGNQDLFIAVDILEAFVEFRAYALREMQYVSVVLQVSVEDRTSGDLIGTAQGKSWARRKAVLPVHSYEQLFNTALLNSYVNALNQINASQ